MHTISLDMIAYQQVSDVLCPEQESCTTSEFQVQPGELRILCSTDSLFYSYIYLTFQLDEFLTRYYDIPWKYFNTPLIST